MVRWVAFWAIFGTLALGQNAAAQDVSIAVTGGDEELSKQVRAASLSQSLAEDGDSTAQDFVAAARADYRRVLTALYAAGYYSAEISIRVDGQEAAAIAPLDAPAQVNRIAIDVTAGAPFRFGRAAVTPLPPTTEPVEGFESGALAQSDIVRQAVRSGLSAWRDAGHAKAAVASQELRADHTNNLLDAVVALSPGARLTFGALTVTGNEAVRTSAIRRIAGLPEGSVFSPATLDEAVARVRRSGAFDSAAMTEADDIGPGNTLPITLSVSESKPRRFGFGLELSSIEGLTVSSFWMHRNAFGGAERFRVEGEVSGIGGETGGTDYRLATSLGIPAVYGPETDFLANFEISKEDEPTYEIDKISTEARVTRKLADDLVGNLGIGLLRAREDTSSGVRRYTLLTLPLGLEWDKRDSASNTKSGYYIDVDATPFIGLEGSENGARLFADARGYASFGEDENITMAARFQIGSLVGASPADAPADFLFFSGGGGTVRGQGYKTLGVTDASGDLRGGASFAGGQLETRVEITEAIGLVGFYDFGYVGDDTTPFSSGDWHAGAGVGIRYNTGIGPIRLDVGTPANGADKFDSVQVYIGIGQAF